MFNGVNVIPNPSENSGGSTNPANYKIVDYGTVITTASARNPYGSIFCDGTVVTKAAYPDLYLAIGQVYQYQSNVGTTYFNASTDFVVPNLMNALSFPTYSTLIFPTGGSNFSQLISLTGGSNNVTLTSSNVPSHSHALTNNGSQYTGGGSVTAVQANFVTASGNTGAAIYNSAGTIVVASGATPTTVNVRNAYNNLASLIRATYVIPSSYQLGYVNFTNANNQFFMTCAVGSLPTPSFIAIPAIMPTGSFTILQTMNNLAAAFGNALVTKGYTGATGSVITNKYSYNNVGNWVCKMSVPPVTAPGGSGLSNFLGYVGITFAANTSNTTYTGTIPYSVLDATALTLGFQTRQQANAPDFTEELWGTGGNSPAVYDYIYAPNPMQIYWGSIGDGTISASQFASVINNF